MAILIIMAKYCPFQAQRRKMKFLLFILFLNGNLFLQGQGRWFDHTFEISKSDCGRAEPSDVTLWSKRNKSYFAYKTIYIYKKDKCIDSVKTDSTGRVSKKFKSGKYSFYLAYKHFKKLPFGLPSQFDMICMEKEWKRPDATLQISWRGTHLINRAIGHQFCEWEYNCLKERHIPPSSSKQN